MNVLPASKILIEKYLDQLSLELDELTFYVSH